MLRTTTLVINFGQDLSHYSPHLYECLNSDFCLNFAGDSLATLTDPQPAIYLFIYSNDEFNELSQAIQICKNLKKKIIVLYEGSAPISGSSSLIFTLSLNQSELYERLKMLLKLCHPSCIEAPNQETLSFDRLPSYVEHHLLQSLNEPEVAQLFGYSSSYFSKRFYQQFGLNFSDFVTQTRITHAKRLLRQDKKSKIAHIAYHCGFNDASYFSKVFKKKTGTTPAAYRQNY